MTHTLTGEGLHVFGITIKLLLGIRRVNIGQIGKHHTLVTARKVIQKLLDFRTLLFKIIRNGAGEIVIVLLLSQKVHHVTLYT